ncbi:MAG: glycosyltransferase [Candidatus Acidiferrales bacterium]
MLATNNAPLNSPSKVTLPVAKSARRNHSPQDNRPYILYLIDQFTGIQAGGAERALLNITRHLPQERFRCSVATFAFSPDAHLGELFSCPVTVFPLRRTYDANALKIAWQLRRLIRSQGVSLVHTFFETSDLWGGAIAKLSGCPLIISSRRDMGILRKPKHNYAYRLSRSWVDRVLTVSDQVRSFVIEQDGMDPAKIETLYSGVDLQLVDAPRNSSLARANLGLEEASHVITTVGNIRRVKGLDVFIRAAARVVRELPHAVFLIVGNTLEDKHRLELEGLRDDLGLSRNLRFTGGQNDVQQYLDASDVFCLLSRSEGFSMALLEAMARSLPSVVTDVGGNSEAIEEGESGFVVKNEDSETAALRILQLLHGPDLRRKMGLQARQRVNDRFTMEAMIGNLTRIYDQLLLSRGISICTP